MKILVALLFYFFSASIVQSQDLNVVRQDAEKLEALFDEKGAFNKYKIIVKYDPKNLNALVKCSELCSRIGKRETESRSRDSYYQAALMYATNAIKLYPASDEANVAMGIALGRNTLTKSGKDKIAAAKDIKQYAETALKINPKNFKAWHIIGKWHYEVSNLSMMERAAARVIYGGLPEASLKRAIAAYETAKSLNPGFLLNYLELAKAYKRNSEKQKSIALLKTLLTLPSKIEDDARIKNETASLLKTWQ